MSKRENNCNTKNMTRHNQTIRLPKIFLTLSAEETTKGAFYNDFKKNLLNTKNGLSRFFILNSSRFYDKIPSKFAIISLNCFSRMMLISRVFKDCSNLLGRRFACAAAYDIILFSPGWVNSLTAKIMSK